MKPELHAEGSSSINTDLSYLQRKMRNKVRMGKYYDMIRNMEFRVPVLISLGFSAYSITITFTLYSNEALLDVKTKNPDKFSDVVAEARDLESEGRTLIADVVRNFGIRLERKFNEYSGDFYWVGIVDKIKDGDYTTQVSLHLSGIPSSKCTIKPVETMVKSIKYVAECK